MDVPFFVASLIVADDGEMYLHQHLMGGTGERIRRMREPFNGSGMLFTMVDLWARVPKEIVGSDYYSAIAHARSKRHEEDREYTGYR
jgi:hypothetical protein